MASGIARGGSHSSGVVPSSPGSYSHAAAASNSSIQAHHQQQHVGTQPPPLINHHHHQLHHHMPPGPALPQSPTHARLPHSPVHTRPAFHQQPGGVGTPPGHAPGFLPAHHTSYNVGVPGPQPPSGEPSQPAAMTSVPSVVVNNAVPAASGQAIAGAAAARTPVTPGVFPATTPGVAGVSAVVPPPGGDGKVLDRKRLQELVKEVDPLEQLDEDVEEMLLQIADDFIDSVVTSSCNIAKHRKANSIDVKDVQLHLERNWNMWIPGFGSEELKPFKKSFTTEAHKQRMALLRKTLKKY